MEKNSKGIIIGIIIVLVVIIGITLFFTTKNIIGNNEANLDNTQIGPHDAEENIPAGNIATPTDSESDNATDFKETP